MTEKMKISAVICELNPLHFGHLHLLSLMKKTHDAVVCILSGNFVQRGEPAVIDKWSRTRLALEAGADLVIELPLPWAMSGAEHFALGGVTLASALRLEGSLFFGCEDAELSLLEPLRDALLSPEFSEILKGSPGKKGLSFAKRREAAVSALLGKDLAALLQKPNNILAVEYLKALKKSHCVLTPVPVLRVGAKHDKKAEKGEFLSAGELRESIFAGKPFSNYVPENTARTLEDALRRGRAPGSLQLLERSILCKLRSMPREAFSALPDISEGLENKLYLASREAGTLEELFSLIKSKRYSHARVRRLVLSAFLEIPVSSTPPYLRVLGMNSRGEQVLKASSPALPAAIRPSEFQKLPAEVQSIYELECRADDLYALSLPVPYPCGRDQREALIKL